MDSLAVVYKVKIVVTLLFWVGPLVLLPAWIVESVIGFPSQYILFLRLLGCAYLSLGVGYWYGLQALVKDGTILPGPVWVGIVSNGGGCLYVLYYGFVGTWSNWHVAMQFLMWTSAVVTGSITFGLYRFGAIPLLNRGDGTAVPHSPYREHR